MKHPDLQKLFESALADVVDPEAFLAFLVRGIDHPGADPDAREVWEDAVALTLQQPEVAALFLANYGRIVSDRPKPDVKPFLQALKDSAEWARAEADELQAYGEAKWGDEFANPDGKTGPTGQVGEWCRRWLQ